MTTQPGYKNPYKRPGFWARLTSGNPTEAQLGYLLLVPAFLVLALVMFYPILNVVWKALHYEKLNLPARGTPFVGLENFREMTWGEGLRWSADAPARLAYAPAGGYSPRSGRLSGGGSARRLFCGRFCYSHCGRCSASPPEPREAGTTRVSGTRLTSRC